MEKVFRRRLALPEMTTEAFQGDPLLILFGDHPPYSPLLLLSSDAVPKEYIRKEPKPSAKKN